MRAMIAILLMTLFTTGCLVTRDQLRSDGGAPSRVRSEPLTPEQQKNSSQVVKAQEQDELIRQIMGRIEVLENSVGVLNADKSGSRMEHDAAQKAQEEKLKIYEEAIVKLEARVNELSARLEAKKSTETAAKNSNSPSGGGKSTFDQADSEYTGKKWKEAIVGFEKYRTNNPNGKKYAEATYKIAASFHELGLRSEAKAFYAEVTEKFPNTDWAKKAQTRLKALK